MHNLSEGSQLSLQREAVRVTNTACVVDKVCYVMSQNIIGNCPYSHAYSPTTIVVKWSTKGQLLTPPFHQCHLREALPNMVEV